jgi:hypothetical protein
VQNKLSDPAIKTTSSKLRERSQSVVVLMFMSPNLLHVKLPFSDI